MNLALDSHLSYKMILPIEAMGHKVVYHAAEGEDDEEWVMNALSWGAEVFISTDLDIPNLLDKLAPKDTRWIDVPQGFRKGKTLDHILSELKKLERLSHEQHGQVRI